MPDVIKRLKYYNGQFLQEPDFTAEQEYHLDRQRRHNRQLHVPGIADGLAVTVGTTSVSVAPGTAIDGQGRQIVLDTARTVGFASSLNGQSALVVISYAEEASDDATVGDAGKTRWKEAPLVEAILENGAPPPTDRIPLARLQISSTGTVAQQDMTVRAPAGARLRPEEVLERLRLSRQGVSSSQWPVLSSGAANQADLAGSLNVTGNILLSGNVVVTGNVDGRDVSADGALNDTHRGRTDNPHSVTAAQVGALASIAGVANPGGNVALAGATGISISTNTTTKTVTVTGGAPTSIDGVSNPGGNIDFVGQGGILITPDNTGKLIAFNTDLTQSGTYMRRSMASASFTQSDADGATRTINVGFRPKFIWMEGATYAYITGTYGGAISGLCRCDDGGSFSAAGQGPVISRYASAPYTYLYHYLYTGANIISYIYYYDANPSPNSYVYMYIYMDSVSSNGFTVRLNKNSFSGYNVPTFSVDMMFSVLG